MADGNRSVDIVQSADLAKRHWFPKSMPARRAYGTYNPLQGNGAWQQGGDGAPDGYSLD